VLQVSLAVTLLIVAALVVQSMQAIVVADLGYDPSPLLSAQIDVARWKTDDDQEALRLRQRVLARVRNIPGVETAAMTTELPALQFADNAQFDINGRRPTDERDRPSAGLTIVTADYFRVFGVPILAGRGFDPADASHPRAVAVVTAEAVRRFWPSSSDAIGSIIQIADPAGRPIEATVIGVARNVANPMITRPSEPTLYLLDEHRPTRTMQVVVRAAAPASLARATREAIAEVDPDLPAYQLRTVIAAMEDENSSNVLLSGMFVAFAAIAVLLAMAGLYGVMSYAVSQRSGEIAVRLALGAPTRAITRQVIGQSVTLAAIGIAIGALCAYLLARSIASLLFGVTAADLVTYAVAIALTFLASLLATWLPMRRAATIDPLEGLRRT
jgi:predicted permease